MSQVTVREAAIHDLPQLRKLMLAYIVDFYQYRQPEDSKLDHLMRTLLEQKEGIQFVAETGAGELVGFATLYFTYSTLRASRVAVMNDLFVADPWRGEGAAQQLFAACKTYAARNGFANLSWETARDNFRAQRFYDKMGGEPGDWLSYSIDPTKGGTHS